jgi:hypothetical protein
MFEVDIALILEGCYDLKIPRMVAIVQSVSLTHDGSLVLELEVCFGEVNLIGC